MQEERASDAAAHRTSQADLPPVTFSWKAGQSLSSDELAECAQLYSAHYGTWSERGVAPNKPVQLRPGRLASLLNDSGSRAILARIEESIVAYAFAVRAEIDGHGPVMWVTQLVVHEQWRHRGLAKRLLSSMWSFSDMYAWGLVTANPYAVRALEKATRRRCNIKLIENASEMLLATGQQSITYLQNTMLKIDSKRSVIDTKFYVRHQGITRMIKLATQNAPWTLGTLKPGEEWFAFTFGSQSEFPLEADELTMMLADVDDIAKRAYEGMTLNEKHRWMRHTPREVDFLIEALNIQPGASVLDYGCGGGRHSIELARRGFDVVGVDFSPRLVQKARESAAAEGLRVRFIEADCRTFNLGRTFDAAICLYDVVGTFPDDADNAKILAGLGRHLRRDGGLVLSVLNFSSLELSDSNTFDLYREPGRLQALKASELMEGSGQIFDPNYFLVDLSTHVVYRKERFSTEGDQLPTELIVRDRRYTPREISSACADAGFEVTTVRPVRAGQWDGPLLAETSVHAREVLLVGRWRHSTQSSH